MDKHEVAMEIVKASAQSGGLKNKSPDAVAEIYTEILGKVSKAIDAIKRKPGRPASTKNKVEDGPKRKPGRPPFSETGKKTIAEIRAEEAAALKIAQEAKAAAKKSTAKKSTAKKNKTTAAAKTATSAKSKTTATSGRRGRPKGSKNKAKPVEAATA